MKHILLSLMLLFVANAVIAEVKTAAWINSGMVLQRNQPINIMGTANLQEEVVITFLKKKYSTKADNNGNWQISLPMQSAGGPYEMSISNIKLTDILIGDVFLCSGQSNMELPVRRVMDMFADEVNTDSCPNVRMVTVPRRYNFHNSDKSDFGATWKSLKPNSVAEFSAIAYFFAKEYFNRTGIPVGVVASCVGGSPVEAWMSEAALQPFQYQMSDLRLCQNDQYVAAENEIALQRNAAWNKVLYSTPISNEPWRPMSLFASAWATDGLNPINGLHLFKRTFELTANQIKGDAIIRLGCIVDADSVFVNGVFVGTTSYQYPPRKYSVPQSALREGTNTVEIHLVSGGGTACFVPDKPYKIITVDGQVDLSTGWSYKLGVRMPSQMGGVTFHYKPASLFNGMIAPLCGQHFAGALWYQGESNVSRRNEYSALLQAMMKDWRQYLQQPDMHFYIIELAAFMHPQDDGAQSAWSGLRSAQADAVAADGKASLIRNSDLGEWNDIHPLDKKSVAKRVVDATIGK